MAHLISRVEGLLDYRAACHHSWLLEHHRHLSRGSCQLIGIAVSIAAQSICICWLPPGYAGNKDCLRCRQTDLDFQLACDLDGRAMLLKQ